MKKEGKKGKINRKAQVTIFIILAIIIVAAILVFFFFIRPRFFPTTKAELSYETCVKDVIERNSRELGLTAGFRKPTFSYRYNGQEIPYLCYTSLYHYPCTMQKPFLKQHFEENLLERSRAEIESCVDTAIDNMKVKGYVVTSPAAKKEINISIEPQNIIVAIFPPITMEKGTTEKFDFNPIKVYSPLYEMLMISTSILQFEGKYGDSDISIMMGLYPNNIIDKLRDSDENKVYIVQDKESQIKFQFVTRSYAWPPGYGISV